MIFIRFAFDGLKEKLGCILFQLPPSFHYSPEKLDLITESLYPDFKTAVEFRHQSWWSEEVYKRLAKNNITFCSVSHPTLPAVVVGNAPIGYVRLHGVPKMFYSEYSDAELNKLYQDIIGHTPI